MDGEIELQMTGMVYATVCLTLLMVGLLLSSMVVIVIPLFLSYLSVGCTY